MNAEIEKNRALLNLPNAAHIDRVLEHLRKNPELWGAARGAAWDAAWDAARGAAQDAAQDAARGAARDAAWDAAWGTALRYAARDEAWDAAREAAREAAWSAVSALIAWDSAGALLDNALQDPEGVGAMRMLAETGSHACALLLPAVIAMKE
jgi:hypothetical protein